MYVNDDSRWSAVRDRDPKADQAFVYCVRTTKIYCRPICKARLARRSNVIFYSTPLEAQNAGYRACKRCKPEIASSMPDEDAVRKIMDFVAHPPQNMALSNLDTMAKQTGLSKWHFHRVFKKVVGMTPSQYANTFRTESSTTSQYSQNSSAIFDLSSSSTAATSPLHVENPESVITWDFLDFLTADSPEPDFLDVSSMLTGESMSNTTNKIDIQYTIRDTSFGPLLIALQNGKVCMVNQSGDESDLLAALENKFPSALYNHLNVSGMGLLSNDPTQHHIEVILKVLDKPA